ncbi:MAG: S41 family peptidase [Alphaproteobacteria bacterium]
MKKSIAGILGLFFILTALSDVESSSDATYRELDLLAKVLELVKDTYVEEVDEQQLLEAAIRGMLNDLDPHSGYMDVSTFRENQIQSRGEYGGLGMEIVPANNVLRIVAPMDDTPASRAGLKAGDYITHINDEPLTQYTSDEAVEMMRGPAGTDVKIRVFREGEGEPFDLELTREVIVLKTVRHRIERETIGYIRLTTFNNEHVADDLRRAIEDIKAELGDNITGFVLDLRNNPGGLLDMAIDVTDIFLERGEIVSMRGRRASENARWNATRGDLTDGLPIVILVNAGSASASEIVAGALQDHERATIIGEESFGKGLVQTVYPLSDDRAVRVTTARYYTPSGKSIQGIGVVPNIIVVQPIFDRSGKRIKVRRERDLFGALENEEIAGEGEEIEPEQLVIRPEPEPDEDGNIPDYQLRYALDFLQGVVQIEQRQAMNDEEG